MITYAQETLAAARADIETLIPAQWEETGDKTEVMPNWQLYGALEATGLVILVVAREEGRAIGYFGGILHSHPNARELMVATFPTYFMEHGQHRALRLKAMFAEGIRLARARGAWKINIETEYNHSAGRILEAMGFVPSAVKYVMPPHHLSGEVAGHA